MKPRYIDKKVEESGNITYIYSPSHLKKRTKLKSKKVVMLAHTIKSIKKQTKIDIKSDDPILRATALAVALIDHTYERVGNPDSANEGHFGVTTWRKKHISFSNNTAKIKYVGKSGVKQEKIVKDKTLVNALKDISKSLKPNDEIFPVSANAVNNYLKQFKITAKDIRGFHANQEMKKLLPNPPKDEKKRKELFKKTLEETAKIVGHEPSTLKKHYLVPSIEEMFMSGKSPQIKIARLQPPKKLSDSIENWVLAQYEKLVRQHLEFLTDTNPLSLDPFVAYTRNESYNVLIPKYTYSIREENNLFSLYQNNTKIMDSRSSDLLINKINLFINHNRSQISDHINYYEQKYKNVQHIMSSLQQGEPEFHNLFDLDLSDSKFNSDRKLLVNIKVEKNSQFLGLTYFDSFHVEIIIPHYFLEPKSNKEFLNFKLSLRSTIEHELIHILQFIIAEIKNLPAPVGKPKRNLSQNDKLTKEENEPYLNNLEFFPYINDVINDFKKLNILTRSDLIKAINNEPILNQMRTKNKEKWKNAVKIIYKEFPNLS